MRSEFSTWPKSLERVSEVLNAVQGLPSASLPSFAYDAGYYMIDSRSRIKSDIWRSITDQPLIDAGLVEPTSTNGEKPTIRLTPKGVLAARLLIAEWPPPAELASVSDKIQAFRESMTEDNIEFMKQVV